MAKKMFEVEIRNNEPKGYETAVSLRMPATWSEFHDALQKARIKDGRSCGNELLYVGYDGLQRGMIGRNINLYDLNLLAQRLTALTPEENTGMEALLAMEWSRRRGPVSLEHLINLTYNTDVCCLAPQVSNLQELGAFLYENEMLSKEAMALLDTTEEDSEFRASLLKLLGEQHKEDHGGVFTKRGYAELGGEIRPVYAYQPGETTYFQRSGAPVVLEVRKGFFNDPQYTFFTMGGASSHDIQDGILDPEEPGFEERYWRMRRARAMFRVKGVSWWTEELPSDEEYEEARKNLDAHDWAVDYILTHCAPTSITQKIIPHARADRLTDFLEEVKNRARYHYWLFGHLHDNQAVDKKHILLWEQVVQVI